MAGDGDRRPEQSANTSEEDCKQKPHKTKTGENKNP
jgi:hypothetical protein